MKSEKNKTEESEKKVFKEETIKDEASMEEIPEKNTEDNSDVEILPVEEEIENAEVEILKAEIAKLNDSIMRERAEFQNYRKRTSQEALLAEGRTAGKILQEIMPAFDAFDQLLTTASTGDSSMEKFLEGAQLIKKQLWQVFENLGVEEINPDQMEFDPQTMEALSVQEAEDVKTDTVTQVYQKGYRFKERILRPARVSVKKPIAG
jgi:molecular chaperone GrpE